MKNDSYLIPANSKKGLLILNIFRPFDLILFGTGVFITMLLIIVISPSSLIATILVLLPGLLTGLLVTPVPNYHNVLIVLSEAIKYYSERQNYIWKGWHFYEEFEQK